MKEDITSRYGKYVFLPGKINSVIVSLVLLGLFTDRNDAFPYPKKSYPFLAEPPLIGHYVELKRAISDLQNEHTYLMHAHASLYTDVPPMIVQKIKCIEFIFIQSARSVLNQNLSKYYR